MSRLLKNSATTSEPKSTKQCSPANAPLISRNGKTVAALISYEDLKLLEEYEELLDIEALRKARAEDDGYRIGLDEFLAENPAD